MSMEFLKGPSGLGQFHKDQDPAKAALANQLSQQLEVFQKTYGDIPLPNLPIQAEAIDVFLHTPEQEARTSMPEAFVLVGPLAAGKTHIGKLIEESFGIPYFPYEDIFIREQRENPDGYLQRAEPLAERAIFDFLEQNGTICFENTMDRPYAKQILARLQEIADVRVIYVDAPPEVVTERYARRDQSQHVTWASEEMREIYARSRSLGLKYDLVLHNADASAEDLRRDLAPLMDERIWHDDHVAITYRGQTMKFNSWNGANMTDYDMEYKPWKVAFHKENEAYLAHYDIKPGDTVVDAGGYEGTFALYAAKAVGEEGRVIVFEPDSENHRKLQENIALNGLTNITVINKGLWNTDTTLTFNNKGTAGASINFNSSPYAQRIDVVSLDNELERLGVSKVDFIKMDVEGSELAALEGAKNILAASDANLAVASYHIVYGEPTAARVEDILRKFGYESVTEYPQTQTTTFGAKKEKVS